MKTKETFSDTQVLSKIYPNSVTKRLLVSVLINGE